MARAGEAGLVGGLPRVTIRRLGGAGHLSNLDRPDEFADAIAPFAGSLAG